MTILFLKSSLSKLLMGYLCSHGSTGNSDNMVTTPWEVDGASLSLPVLLGDFSAYLKSLRFLLQFPHSTESALYHSSGVRWISSFFKKGKECLFQALGKIVPGI